MVGGRLPSSTSSTGPQIAIWQNAGVATRAARSARRPSSASASGDVVERARPGRWCRWGRRPAHRSAVGVAIAGRASPGWIDEDVLGGVDLDRHLERLAVDLGAAGVDARLVDGEAQREVGARQPLGVARAPRSARPTVVAGRRRARVTVSASGVSSTGSRPSASATPNGRTDLAAGRQHREPAEELHEREPAARRLGRGRAAAPSSPPHAPSSTAPASGAAPERGTGGARRERAGGGTSERTYPPPMADRSQPHGLAAGGRRAAGRRGRRRRARCSTCCATSSASARRRTAAAPRASAAAARCWSTASRGSRA